MRELVFVFLAVLCVWPAQSQVRINELQSSNSFFHQDEFGEYNDWFELYNYSDTSVNLSGWGVSDDKSELQKWIFPDVTIDSGSYMLVYASGKDIKQQPAYWRTVVKPDDLFFYLVPSSQPDESWRDPAFDASGWKTGRAGFGYGDDDDSTLVNPSTRSIFIRRSFMVDNVSDVVGAVLHIDFDDGFIAYLNGVEIARENMGTAVNIYYNAYATGAREATLYAGAGLSDFHIDNIASILKEGENTLAIQVHNVNSASSDMSLIPYLSISKTNMPDTTEINVLNLAASSLHTGFKLKSGGEAIYLSNSDAVLIDSVGAIQIPTNYSYGTNYLSGELKYFLHPTPGARNDSVVCDLLANDSVLFTQTGGFFTTPFTLDLSNNEGEKIFYTTDGTDPDTSSALYSSSINIDSSQTIKARIISEAYLPGKVYSTSFIFDRKPTLPVICLNTEPELLWDEEVGMYAYGNSYEWEDPHYGANFWNEWEYPFNLTYIDDSGKQVLSQSIGAKIFGGWSRANDQRSFALFARKQYGAKSFNHSFFGAAGLDTFSSLVLRNSGNDWEYTHMRDGLMTGLVAHLGIDMQAYSPVAVYLNNDYWGIYNLREKVNEDFLAAHHNLKSDEITILEKNGVVIEGNNTEYLNFVQYLDINRTIVSKEQTEKVLSTINLDNYIKYQLAQIYFDNGDWPGNNIKFWKSNAPGSRWEWVLFDTDFGFGLYTDDFGFNTLELATNAFGPDWPNPPWSTLLFRRVLTNTEMRNNFINQMADNINTTFLSSRVSHFVDSLSGVIQSEMMYHTQRWEKDYSNWQYQVEKLKHFGSQRPQYVRSHLKQFFSLPSQQTIRVSVSDTEKGFVRLNTLELHDFPFSGVYFESVPVTISAVPKPGYTFVGWSGSNNSSEPTIVVDLESYYSIEANFEETTTTDIRLVINEINYYSTDVLDGGDWIEIYNPSSTTYDISGVYLMELDGDTAFVFPEGTYLEPCQYLVVAYNAKKFSEAYPYVKNVLGELPFGLSSTGDELRLYNSDGSLIDAVDYLPYSPWPDLANGKGYTLELISPNLENGLGENWVSNNYGGSPGSYNGNILKESNSIELVLQNTFEVFPTRFSDFVTIQFEVEEPTNIKIQVFDAQGRLIQTVVDETNMIVGEYSIDWIPETALQPGIYIIRLTNNAGVENKRVVYF